MRSYRVRRLRPAAACQCLPLDNYHNMADIDGAAQGKKAAVGREFVSAADFPGLLELPGAAARGLDAPVTSPRQAMEKSRALRPCRGAAAGQNAGFAERTAQRSLAEAERGLERRSAGDGRAGVDATEE